MTKGGLSIQPYFPFIEITQKKFKYLIKKKKEKKKVNITTTFDNIDDDKTILTTK